MRNRRLPLSCGLTFSAILTIAAALMARPVLAQGLTPEPLPIPPTPTAVVDGWIAAGNETAIRDHAWALWAAANSPSKSPPWPIWETWYTDTEVSKGPPPAGPAMLSAARRAGRPENVFHVPRQFVRARALQRRLLSPLAAVVASPGEQVLGFNKFDPTYAGHVWSNQFQNPNNLWTIQNGWPAGTPVANRHIPPFPATAIGLKPVFEVARGPNNGGVTVLNYWLGDLTTGPQNSTNPQAPTSDTWKQCVVVQTGSGPVPPGLTCPNGGTPSGTVTQNDFYSFQLEAAEVQSICGSQSPCAVKVGDYALLVAMHLTTRENDNWTWQTFWWNYNQPFPYGAPPSTIPAPFNRYAMCTAYSMTVNPPNNPKGTNTLCYNPYLESSPQISDGIQSNCMSCHTVASYGSNANNPGYPNSYQPNAYISVTVPGDVTTYFGCQTTTDTSWFLAFSTGNSPTTPPPCTP